MEGPCRCKGERLDVSFEIKGEGEIDAEALNRFHGAHFGDELETEDEEVAEEVVEESAEEVVEEASEEASEDEASEDADEAEALQSNSEKTSCSESWRNMESKTVTHS